MATVVRSADTQHWSNAWPTGSGKAGPVHPARTRPRQKHRRDARAATVSNDYGLCKSSGNFAIFAVIRRAQYRELAMRLLIFVLGVFVAVVCAERPAEAQNYPWCAYYDFKDGGATNCGFAISTMLGHRERNWRIVWTQSAVPRPARSDD
jgi:hypothetical protein